MNQKDEKQLHTHTDQIRPAAAAKSVFKSASLKEIRSLKKSPSLNGSKARLSRRFSTPPTSTHTSVPSDQRSVLGFSKKQRWYAKVRIWTLKP